MKVSELIKNLQELNPDYEIGIAHEEHGVVDIQAFESDVANEVYRIV